LRWGACSAYLRAPAVGATRRPFCLTEQPGAMLLIWRAHLRPRTSANLGQNRRLNVLSARPWGDLLHETKVVGRSPRRGKGGRPFWAAAKILQRMPEGVQ
jgi:hypothetical protein